MIKFYCSKNVNSNEESIETIYMRIKVSDYIADFFAKEGIETIFTVVGGGAMHMNHSFGHHNGLKCIYNHHEQASSIATEAYFRVNGKMAGLCVTSGPGAINALNGVIGAYQDSIPMIVVSGQTKTTLLTKSSGLPLRTFGNQEFDIISCLSKACKYSVMIEDAKDIKYHLEKAFFLAKNGRPGPCWLDIPIDIQGTYVETEDLRTYVPEHIESDSKEDVKTKICTIIKKLSLAKRPVIYAGNGVRIAGAQELLNKVAEKYDIPVVTCWDSIDLMETNNRYYAGRAGIMGDRAGNFAVQNSDLLICVGNRLNVYQIGYQYETWAREAYKIMVDIDPLELKKPTISIDLPICYDAKEFLTLIMDTPSDKNFMFSEWVEKCNEWKNKYPVVSEKQHNQQRYINVYAFMDRFSKKLPAKTITVVANGSASVVGSAAYYIGNGQRFIMNCALSSMGYDLPASIGASCAVKNSNGIYDENVICIAGDGSIQMNLQELQTIVTNRLPIKMVVINNEGYHQIRLTQTNLFNKEFVGIGPESNDLGFPSFEKISYAYGIPYITCDSTEELDKKIDEFLSVNGYALLEVFCDTTQVFEPKSATKRLEDGTLYSPPLEDLYPFLDRKELRDNMIIPMISE